MAVILTGLFPVAAAAGGGTPTVVKVRRDETGYHLLRDGRPYMIKGAGGRMYFEALKEAGGTRCGPAERKRGRSEIQPPASHLRQQQ